MRLSSLTSCAARVLIGGDRNRARNFVFTRGLAMVSLAASLMAAFPAHARPTGWLSPSELQAGAADAWSGYGESGYVARTAQANKAAAGTKSGPRSKAKVAAGTSSKASKSALAKSKALQAYAATYGDGPKTRKASGKKYAALDTKAVIDVAPTKSLSGGSGVRWVAPASCLNGALKSVVAQVAANYGAVTVNSTCRDRKRNARVGGARKSHHLTGNAVDFRVRGNIKGAYAFLRSHGSVGGFKHYGGGLFHIDTGPRRTW
jgi:uncharacterized protein YcbK (DUF882 family)